MSDRAKFDVSLTLSEGPSFRAMSRWDGQTFEFDRTLDGRDVWQQER